VDQTIADLQEELDEHDLILRGDGNGTPGLSARVRTLEANQKEVLTMLKEWTSFKDQVRGAKLTVIAVGLLIALLGGGLGVAILTTLGKVAAALP
jgi:hypothetical protein